MTTLAPLAPNALAFATGGAPPRPVFGSTYWKDGHVHWAPLPQEHALGLNPAAGTLTANNWTVFRNEGGVVTAAYDSSWPRPGRIAVDPNGHSVFVPSL